MGWAARSRARWSTNCTPARFTEAGTFDAAIDKLDYLVDLGVDFVEVMPVNAFNGTHGWGYDGVLWYAVHEPYGGPDGLVRLIDACHARGLGVLIDAVFNHFGPSGNYLPKFGPYLVLGEQSVGRGREPGRTGCRRSCGRFIIECALRWMRDFHADGLRLDAVHALVDNSAIHILEELAAETDALAAEVGRPLSLIAESDLNDPRLITPRDRGGYGLTAQWDDDIHHAIHTAVSGERQGYYADFGTLATLATTLRNGYFHAGTYSSFRHRRHGRPLDKSLIPATRLMAYTCTHDQVGQSGRRGPSVAESRLPASWRSRLPSFSDHPIQQCFSWVRSGAHRARSSSSARIPSPSLPRRRQRVAKQSSPTTAGMPTTSPTRRTFKPSWDRSWTGRRSASAITRPCCRSTGG